MRASPIQLLETTLIKVSIEPIEAVESAEPVAEGHGKSLFNLTTFEIQTSKGIIPYSKYWDDKQNPPNALVDKTYLIHLGVRTVPEVEAKGLYRFEVVVTGVVGVFSAEKDSPEKMAYQYGLTLLFGVVREQLMALTLKMSNGSMMLPTMSFLDETPPEIKLSVSAENK